MSSNLNPGNSGGPVVDTSTDMRFASYKMKLTGSNGIGFAVPIDEVKSFLEAKRARSRAAHPSADPRTNAEHLEGKGIRLPLPEGFSDVSPFRSRVETDVKTERHSHSGSTASFRRSDYGNSTRPWRRRAPSSR